MKSSSIYNDFLKKYANLSGLGMVTSSMLTELIEVGSNVSELTLQPGKNYAWSPLSQSIYLDCQQVSQLKFQSTNLLLTLPVQCAVTYGENVTVVDQPKAGEANRVKVEWIGNAVRLYLNGVIELSGSGEGERS